MNSNVPARHSPPVLTASAFSAAPFWIRVTDETKLTAEFRSSTPHSTMPHSMATM